MCALGAFECFQVESLVTQVRWRALKHPPGLLGCGFGQGVKFRNATKHVHTALWATFGTRVTVIELAPGLLDGC